MFAKTLALAAVLAITGVNAVPHVGGHHQHLHRRHNQPIEARDDDTFDIEVINKCSEQKHFGLYEITSSFQMIEKCDPAAISAGGSTTLQAGYKDLGIRLSATADQGAGAQWAPQSLAEFGYSGYGSLEGTAYDVSMMDGSDQTVGVKIETVDNGNGSGSCETKKCTKGDMPLDQCWTHPNQVADGSPADTVCYKGKTAFKVTFCYDN